MHTTKTGCIVMVLLLEVSVTVRVALDNQSELGAEAEDAVRSLGKSDTAHVRERSGSMSKPSTMSRTQSLVSQVQALRLSNEGNEDRAGVNATHSSIEGTPGVDFVQLEGYCAPYEEIDFVDRHSDCKCQERCIKQTSCTGYSHGYNIHGVPHCEGHCEVYRMSGLRGTDNKYRVCFAKQVGTQDATASVNRTKQNQLRKEAEEAQEALYAEAAARSKREAEEQRQQRRAGVAQDSAEEARRTAAAQANAEHRSQAEKQEARRAAAAQKAKDLEKSQEERVAELRRQKAMQDEAKARKVDEMKLMEDKVMGQIANMQLPKVLTSWGIELPQDRIWGLYPGEDDKYLSKAVKKASIKFHPDKQQEDPIEAEVKFKIVQSRYADYKKTGLL